MQIVLPKADEEDRAAVLPSPSTRQHHLPHLDGLRACLALYVLLHHACMTIWPHLPLVGAGWFANVVLGVMTQGRAAVDWFIVLSGFCLMLPTLSHGFGLKQGAIAFYKKRARRILPTYWIAVAFSIAMCLTVVSKRTGTHWDIALPVTWPAIVSAVLLTNDLWEVGRINHVFWSIAIEWRIYFLFPLILAMWRRWGGEKTTLLVVGLTIAASFCVPHISMSLLGVETSISFVGLFALGAYAAYISCGVEHPEGERVKRRLGFIGIIAIGCFIAATVHLAPRRLSQPALWDAYVGVAAASCLARWSMPGRSLARSVLSLLPLPAIGVFAFSLYLTHAPMLQVCWQLVVRPAHADGYLALALLLVIGTPVSVATAYLFFLAFERPFLSSRQKKAAREEGAVGG